MVNVSRGKNEYGHHLLDLSLRSVHVCVCTFVCMTIMQTHTHTHNVLLERDLEIWDGGKRREEEREDETASRGDTNNKNLC